MWIQVRSFDGKKSMQVDNLSKLTKIEDLRQRLVEHFDAPAETQCLFYRGKMLINGHTLFDYNVGLNDLIQLMVRPAGAKESVAKTTSTTTNGYGSSGEESESSDKENKRPATPEPVCKAASDTASTSADTKDSTYKAGDVIDARDVDMGAWFEAKIMKVVKAKKNNTQDSSSGSSCTSSDKSGDKTAIERKPTVLGEIKDTEDITKDNVLGEKCKTEKDEKCDKASDSVQKEDSMVKDENCNDSCVESMECESDTVENNSQEGTEKTDSSVPCAEEVFGRGEEDGFEYSVVYEGYDDNDPVTLSCKHIRPRARNQIKLSDVTVGQVVMANYNMEDADQRGFWYDCLITGKRDTRTIKELTATVYFGQDLMPLENCKLLFVDEVFAIEKPGTQVTADDVANDPTASPAKRKNKPDCDHCLDNLRRKCKHCACCVCGGKHDPDKQILCDECDHAYHLQCLTPPLDTIPEEEEWYCPGCKNDDSEIVKAGEKLKESKKKSRMASSSSTTTRDWGRGMACVGRTKVCNVVPSNHFGPIPGVQVGTMWKFRVQASEAGVHRPHVAGIHGREDEGAYSIVLSGGYEDDTDSGDFFLYTGSGGRDLSGNKRTAEQSCDQTLTRMNKALAKNCNASLDGKNGATAKEWRSGKPVRVVRNCKGRKHSKFAPEEGNRYDGIYKVVKYWPEKGKSGFIVWRYMMQRDDDTPAPWSKAGQKRAKELGLVLQYPEGYLEAQEKKELEAAEAGGTPAGKGKKGKGKRKRKDSESSSEGSPGKKAKVAGYRLDAAQSKLIKEDTANKKLWDEAVSHTKEGQQKFLKKVEELFNCICCQDIVMKPVTTECSHNICKVCIQRSFKADVYTCPACRSDLGKDCGLPVNKPLSQLLNQLFPGYEAGR